MKTHLKRRFASPRRQVPDDDHASGDMCCGARDDDESRVTSHSRKRDEEGCHISFLSILCETMSCRTGVVWRIRAIKGASQCGDE
jgi:hypothetical protein